MTSNGFYGNAIETYYVDAKGRAWLVQSPELSDHAAVSAELPEGLVSVRPDDDYTNELAEKLDALPRTAGGGAYSARELERAIEG